MGLAENTTKEISGTQKVRSISSTPYKASQKFDTKQKKKKKKNDIKQFLNKHLIVSINTFLCLFMSIIQSNGSMDTTQAYISPTNALPICCFLGCFC